MLRLLGSVVLVLAMLVAGSHAGDVKDKGKDAPGKDPVPTKDPAKDPRAVKGKVLSVDLKGNSFMLEVAGKEQTFKVTKTTEYWGPRGAKGEGLKDDRMEKGYEIIVIASKDGNTAEEVHFPYRKPAEEKKDKKDKKDKAAKDKKK